MEYRQFGKTDLKVSTIGFGCWEIGGTYGRIDETQFRRAVQEAIDSGITCFDTAEAYGMGVSEQALGHALGGRRQDVCIVTKFGVGYDEMPTRRDSSRARVMASIDKSLQRLQTDHVDVYLVHWPDPDTPLDETMRALDDIVQQGKARYIGVSNFRLAQIENCMRLRRIDVVQYGWNMLDRRMQTEIFPYRRAPVRRHATALVFVGFFGYIILGELVPAPTFSTDLDAAIRVWSGGKSELVADGQGPGDRRSMIDGELPSDQRSPRSGSKEHAAVNSAAADQ
jgi:predicted aldo/keto reductase-like oxidoreductase